MVKDVDIHVVYKSVELIHSINSLDILSRKLFNILIYDIFQNGFSDIHSFESYISVKNVKELLFSKTTRTDKIKDSLGKLRKTPIVFNVFKDGVPTEFECGILSNFGINMNVIYYTIDRMVVPMILNPTIYKNLNLYILSLFTSKYGLGLYENCKRFEKVKTTGWKSVEDWKKVLCGDEHYSDFKMFHNKVIKKGVDDCNKLSDIYLRYEFKRTNRKITEIKFYIEKQEMKIFEQKTDNQLHLIHPPKMDFYECITRLVKEGKLSEKILSNLSNKEVTCTS